MRRSCVVGVGVGVVAVAVALTGCTARSNPASAPAPTASTVPASVAPSGQQTPSLSHEAAWRACASAVSAETNLTNVDQWDPMTAARFTGVGDVITIEFALRNGETLNPDGTTTPIRPQATCAVDGTSDAPKVESVKVIDNG